MDSKKNPLDGIIHISIPEELESLSGNMPLDPKILLPVEVPPGIAPGEWQMENLSWEMILSGMLKILAYDPDHEHLPYYREFILTVKPQIIQELTQSAIIKSQEHSYDLPEEIFRALIGLQPEQLRHKLNLAILFENRANHLASLGKEEDADFYRDLAEESYLRLIDQGEALPDVFFNAAWFFFNKQDYSKSTELLNSYLSFSEDETKISEAKKLLKESSNLKTWNSRYNEAYTLIMQDRNQEGIDLINSYLAENSSIWNAWFLKGWAQRKLRQYEEALQAFEKAQALHPTQTDILNEMAICHMELQHYGEAGKGLSKALQLEPENIKVISNMGILSLKQGKKEEAAGFFQTVLELEPEDPIALEYMDFLKKN